MFIFSKLKLYAIGVIGAILALLGIYWQARRDGAAAVKADANEARLNAVNAAKDVEDEIRSLDDDGLNSRARHWLRKDSGQ